MQANSIPQEKEVESDWAGLLQDGCPEELKYGNVQLASGEAAEIPSGYDAFVLEHLFTEDECQRLVSASEEANMGYGKTNYPKEYRGNLRLIAKDLGLTQTVWTRLARWVPKEVTDEDGHAWEAIGLNECWRLAKYFPGDRFGAHCDTNYTRKYGEERSMYTVNIYMNGDFDGGSTRFYKDCGRDKELDFSCTPAPGSCLVFRQPPDAHYLHDGDRLGSGLKYLFRTDVMYRKKQKQKEQKVGPQEATTETLPEPKNEAS